MRSTFLVLAVLFTGVAQAGTPPGLDPARYQALIKIAGEKGEPGQADNYEYRSLSHISPADVTAPHQAEYFSAMGGVDSQGHFGAFEVSAVSEDWRKRANGDWEIEQWMWSAMTDGTLLRVYHMLLIELPGGSVLDDSVLPSGAADSAEELARWGNKITQWYGFAGGRLPGR
ncbi:MAG: hypothetical protein ACXVB9_16400 [Bdellovibrionota bacterium]